jgi:hypothetical protein
MCTGRNPLEMQMYACVSVLVLIACLAAIYAAAALSPRVAVALRSHPYTSLCLKAVTMALSVAYAPLCIPLMQTLFCRVETIPVHAYLAMRQDGTALKQAGITLSSEPTRAELAHVLQVPILLSDTSQVCYESLHAVAYPIAMLTAVVYCVLYPVVTSSLVIYLRRKQLNQSTDGVATLPPGGRSTCWHWLTRCFGSEGTARLDRSVVWYCCCCCAHTRSNNATTSKLDAADERSELSTDALLHPYTRAQFHPAYVCFMIVESFLQLLLAIVAAGWKYPNGLMENRMKALVLCASMLVTACLYETSQPYRLGRAWKSHVKAFSLVVCSLGAIENELLIEFPPDSEDGAVHPALSAWTYVLIVGIFLLLALLVCAFLWSLMEEQGLQGLALTGIRKVKTPPLQRATGTPRRASRHSTANPLLTQPNASRKSVVPVPSHSTSIALARHSAGGNTITNSQVLMSQHWMKNARASIVAPQQLHARMGGATLVRRPQGNKSSTSKRQSTIPSRKSFGATSVSPKV